MSSLPETRQKVFEEKLFTVYKKLESLPKEAGFVYVCINDAWPNLCKIGCTRDPLTRLSTFSVYDPYDSYRLVGYKLCNNMRKYEKILHKLLNEYHLRGEWFDLTWAKAVGVMHEPLKVTKLLNDYRTYKDKINNTKHISIERMCEITKKTRAA